MSKNIRDLCLQASAQLALTSESHHLDAELLLCHLLKKTRAFLYTYPEHILTEEQQKNYAALLAQRAQGTPIAYILGYREFWSLPLMVNADTLIPRPETEFLVETTLELLADKTQARILDLGTGSGAIALALAFERPQWQIFACDQSVQALHTASLNAERLHIKNVDFFASHWFSSLMPGTFFDAIVSNPPYLAAHDPHLACGDLRFEPQKALISGPTGLEDLQHIIEQSSAYLLSQGYLVMEHGSEQQEDIHHLLQHRGYRTQPCVHDLQDHPRISVGQKN